MLGTFHDENCQAVRHETKSRHPLHANGAIREVHLKANADMSNNQNYALAKVRQMAVLRWLPDQLSYMELAFLCRFSKVILLDHASAVKVSTR